MIFNVLLLHSSEFLKMYNCDIQNDQLYVKTTCHSIQGEAALILPFPGQLEENT